MLKVVDVIQNEAGVVPPVGAAVNQTPSVATVHVMGSSFPTFDGITW
jgi:hypothetical protein